jgi:3-oxoisoapionate decarboxylase
MLVISLDYSSSYAAIPHPPVGSNGYTGVRKWHDSICQRLRKTILRKHIRKRVGTRQMGVHARCQPARLRYINGMQRRTFLGTLSAAAAAAATPEPQDVPVRLGFDTYSLRAFGWKAGQLLDYAAQQKLDTIQISSMGDYESFEPVYLQKIRRQAEQARIQIDAGMGCICPSSKSFKKNGPPAEQQIVQGLQVAKAVGAGSMRCFMGSSADRTGEVPIELHMENTIKVFKSVRQQALDLGVKIALENHNGDMQAREVKTIIEESGPEFVASCLDTGNPMWVVEDPFVSLETLAPYVVTTHVRDSAVFEHARGAAARWVVLGEGSVDFVKFTAQFRKLCPQSSMQMELITGRPPRVLPYLERDFWKPFPKAPAAEFARFVALAKSGHPYMGPMVIEDVDGLKKSPVVVEALKEQQRIDLERSFEYARKKLNVGVNWRG